jgi:hypothetical protein
VLLGNIGQHSGPPVFAEGGQVLAVGGHDARARRKKAAQALEERRLPGPVRPDHDRQPGRPDLKLRDAESEVGVAEVEPADDQLHAQALPAFLRRTMNRGMPMRLVKIPTGIV